MSESPGEFRPLAITSPQQHGYFDGVEQLAYMRGVEAGIAGVQLLLDHDPKWLWTEGSSALEVPLPLLQLAARIALTYEGQRAREARSAIRLYDDAIHDQLTGLYNRRIIPDAFEKLQREGPKRREDYDAEGRLKPSFACLIDLDHFKAINDTYGHSAGDIVLVSVAQYMQGSLRDSDTIVRIGGEEFLVLLAHQTMFDALSVLERLRRSIEEQPIELTPDSSINVTASFGLVQIGPEATPEETMAAADSALYQAKGQGRNIVILAGERRAGQQTTKRQEQP
jgi:diguanylate cyclase (GGDEF)-like protein